MDGKKEQWFGPGETARRLGVTTKALRVYEREGLVLPRRAESRWRLYGSAEIARLHQIIVLRDLGLSLKSIKKLVRSRAGLRDVLQLQRERLESQQDQIRRALALIETTQRQLKEGQDLCLDDLAILIRETVAQRSSDAKKFAARFEALVAEEDPTGATSRAVNELRDDLRDTFGDAQKAEWRTMMAEAARLKEAGEVDSQASQAFVRRMRAYTAGVRRPPEAGMMVRAFVRTVAEGKARSEPLPFDGAVFDFIRQITQRMKERGELD